jgi:hypothetical protein
LEMCNYSSRKVKPLLSLYFSLLFFLYMYITFQHTIGVLFFRNSQPPLSTPLFWVVTLACTLPDELKCLVRFVFVHRPTSIPG